MTSDTGKPVDAFTGKPESFKHPASTPRVVRSWFVDPTQVVFMDGSGFEDGHWDDGWGNSGPDYTPAWSPLPLRRLTVEPEGV